MKTKTTALRKPKLAIVGSGISGLSAAYLLRKDYDITIYEKNDYLGGHVNTLEVLESGNHFPIDTGFIVFNHETYPNLTALFQELEVKTEKTSMSFSVYNQNSGLQWAGNSLSTLFAQRRNLFSPQHFRFLFEVNRFNKLAVEDLGSDKVEASLAEYLKKRGFSDYLLENFIIPMGSAVWSTPVEKMLQFPARTLIQFFYNHGFLGLDTQHQWYTVSNGAREYVKKIKTILKANLLFEKVISVDILNNKPLVKAKGVAKKFDKVILACHADEALKILKKPSALQRMVLKAFSYEKNIATLHTDATVMPPHRRIWSAWNYKIARVENKVASSTIYYMNILQNLQKYNAKKPYFVSINEIDPLEKSQVIRNIEYEHPLFDMTSYERQKDLIQLNASSLPIAFCGSYFGYGFHEDGLKSGIQVAELLKKSISFPSSRK